MGFKDIEYDIPVYQMKNTQTQQLHKYAKTQIHKYKVHNKNLHLHFYLHYIYKLTEHPVILLNAIFLYLLDIICKCLCLTLKLTFLSQILKGMLDKTEILHSESIHFEILEKKFLMLRV